MQALEAHQIDGVIAGMQITPERKQKFAMSDPYYKTAVAMAVAKNSGVNQLKDLRGKRVALKTGTAAADFAMSLKSKYGFSTVTFDDSNNMYQDVITGIASRSMTLLHGCRPPASTITTTLNRHAGLNRN